MDGLESGADSVSSTPRSAHPNNLQEKAAVVRLMCSFGGKIVPRPHDNQLRYAGGDTRIVAVHRSISYSSLISKLSKLLPPSYSSGDFTVKYQLPHEDLDALITVSTDEDVDNMMEEFDRLVLQNTNNKVPRLRLFLFPNTLDEDSRTSSIASLLDGSRKRESWFLDALNGDSTSGGGLERGRSEASSIVSEVPDYLFGLDNSDEPGPRFRNRSGLGDVVAGSDPGSPALPVRVASPFGSASSAPPMPNLPPVKTKPEKPVEEINEPPVHQPVGYAGGPVWGHNLNPNTNANPNPNSPYPAPPMQAIPVYYVPTSGPGMNPMPRGHHHPAHMQSIPVQVPGPYVHQYGAVHGPSQVQVPIGYSGSGPMYGGGAGPYEMQMHANMIQGQGQGPAGQPIYYGVKNSGPGMVAAYQGMVGPEEVSGSGSDPRVGPSRDRL